MQHLSFLVKKYTNEGTKKVVLASTSKIESSKILFWHNNERTTIYPKEIPNLQLVIDELPEPVDSNHHFQKITNLPKKLRYLYLCVSAPTFKQNKNAKNNAIIFNKNAERTAINILKVIKKIKILDLRYCKFEFKFQNLLQFTKKLKVLKINEKNCINFAKSCEIKMKKIITTTLSNSSLHTQLITDKTNFPKGLKILSFEKDCRFNQKINKLPEGLKILKLNNKFNQKIDKIPKGLKVLILSGEFNQKIDKLPKGLKVLILSGEFNQKIDKLPKGLKILKFIRNSKFNQKIDKLPRKLKKLYLGYSFDRKLENLPSTLRKINLGYSFNQELGPLEARNLPKKLKILHLSDQYNQPLDDFIKETKNKLKILLQPQHFSLVCTGKLKCSSEYNYRFS